MNKRLPSRRFTKRQRLLTSAQFKAVFDNVDCKQSGKYFTFLSRANPLSQSRLGLIVAKKHVRLAVERNRIKRAIRETFRHQDLTATETAEKNSGTSSNTNKGSQFDLIVLAKSNVHKLDNAQLTQELNKQWLRLKEKRNRL